MRLVFAVAAVGLGLLQSGSAMSRLDGWPTYGHDPGGMRYSPLVDITRANVSRLRVAWTFHTGDMTNGGDVQPRIGFEATPIVIDDTMYLSTATNRIVALDPETGHLRWAYDPNIPKAGDYGDGLISRGVAIWTDTNGSPHACRRRIYEATL